MEHSNTPGYASRQGIPPENMASATVKDRTNFVTRPIPPSPDGINPSGGIEVVVPKGGVTIQSHVSLDK